jgi:hypothetical protein
MAVVAKEGGGLPGGIRWREIAGHYGQRKAIGLGFQTHLQDTLAASIVFH